MTQLGFLEEAPRVEPTPVNTAAWKQYGDVTLYHGDNLDILRAMPANSIDAVVTDPPYGIGFMGKEWDTFTPETIEKRNRKAFAMGSWDVLDRDTGRRRDHENPNVRGRSHSPALSPSQIEYDRTLDGQRGFQQFTETWAREVMRVLKPGGHMLVCGAPRSAHRMVSGIEDAGFEIRDSFAWLFGQGFPKSHNLEGGFGTALKPGHEPIALARKPFDGTVERCMEIWGTGAINIDACRLAALDDAYKANCSGDRGHEGTRAPEEAGATSLRPGGGSASDVGRWPANVLLDEQAASLLDEQAGERISGANPTRRGSDKFRKIFGAFKGEEACTAARGADRGGASRFFFVAKPSRAERDFGCDDLPVLTPGECTERTEGSAGITPYAGAGRSGGGRNFHPTVKPVSLMRWLIRLITPPGGTVLDCFLGSGTTGMAAVLEGHPFIGIDRESKYLTLSDARISGVRSEVQS